MPKYVIGFKKKGYVCYISHLDVMRLFQRAFKQEDIRLKYSKGYNPHPRMGFAQPLTLGYSSETEEKHKNEKGGYQTDDKIS